MTLTNEDRGGLVGAFIVEDGDEILSITQAGQVVRSPINEHFRATGRSTQGVKFVSPRTATRSPWSPARSRPARRRPTRSRTARSRVEDEAGTPVATDAADGAVTEVADADESPDVADDATIESPSESAEE